MVRQTENDVWSSLASLVNMCCKYGVAFKASLTISHSEVDERTGDEC
jgi:hypothetical protein